MTRLMVSWITHFVVGSEDWELAGESQTVDDSNELDVMIDSLCEVESAEKRYIVHFSDDIAVVADATEFDKREEPYTILNMTGEERLWRSEYSDYVNKLFAA